MSNINTLTYDNISVDPNNVDGNSFNSSMIFIDTDTVLIINGVFHYIREYNLTDFNDISTLVYTNKELDIKSLFNITPSTTLHFTFNNDGSKLYVGTDTQTIYEANLSTNYDISTASYSNVNYDLSGSGFSTNIFSFEFNDNGSNLYVKGSGASDIYKFDLSSNFDLSSASFNQTINFNYSFNQFLFSESGSKMIIADVTNNLFRQFSLSTPYDPTSRTLDLVNYDFSNLSTSIDRIAFNFEQTKFYGIRNFNTIWQFTSIPSSPIKLGETDIFDIYKGDTLISKIYKGNTQIK